jgi:KUP system potassium uptake protein
MRLGFLPRLRIRQTSSREYGQIYLPRVNWLLFAAVLLVVVTFGSSARLATAYGIAVTGTFLATTGLLLVVARSLWHWRIGQCVLAGLVFGGMELAYFAANAASQTEHLRLPVGWTIVLTTEIPCRRPHQLPRARPRVSRRDSG